MRKISETLGARQPAWKLEWIRQYGPTQSARQMAEVLRVSESLVYDYCKLHGIALKDTSGAGYRHTPLSPAFVRQCMNKVRSIINKTTGADIDATYRADIYEADYDRMKKMQRPPAKYDNKSRDEMIDELLKM